MGSQSAIKAAGQRLATLMMYLNAPEIGGAVSMPTMGLMVSAKKGNAIYFENIDSQGKANPQTLHAGMPCWWVKNGLPQSAQEEDHCFKFV